MQLLDVYGRLRNKNCERYRIKWDGKSRSQIQFKTKQFLKWYWNGEVVYEEFPVFGTLLKVDILNLTRRIAIEVQGHQHEKFNAFFYNNSRLKYHTQIRNDMKKREWLELNRFKVCEIYEVEVPNLSPEFFLTKFGIQV